MPVLTVSNTSTSRVGVGQHVGSLAPGETKTLTLSVKDLEEASSQLVGLASAGVISWSSAPSTQTNDDDAEFVTLDDLGSPEVSSTPTAPARVDVAGIAANVNNFDDNGELNEANVLRLAPSAPGWNITGLAGGFPGRILHIILASTFSINLTHEDSNSLPENRFQLPGLGTLTLTNSSACTLLYDGLSNRWKVLATAL